MKNMGEIVVFWSLNFKHKIVLFPLEIQSGIKVEIVGPIGKLDVC